MLLAVLKNDIEKFFNNIEKETTARANAKDQNQSNRIPESFKQEYKEDGKALNAKLSAWKWVVAAWETGRGKTVNSGNGALKRGIKNWLDVKGIVPDDNITVDSLAFLIARKIHNEGTRLHRGVDPRFSGRNSGTLSDFINQGALDEFTKDMGATIVTEITEYLRDVNKN